MQMDGVQCPKCRAISYPGLMGFPRCHRCHEQLRQCRYCRDQQHGLCRHDPATRPPLRSEERKPYCDAFATRLAADRGGRLGRRMGADVKVLAATVGVVILLFFGLVTFLGEDRSLRIEPVSPRVYLEAGRTVARFTIHSAPGAETELALRVTPESVEHYLIESPRPTRIDPDGAVAFQLELPANGEARLALELLSLGGAPPETTVTVELAGPEGGAAETARVTVVDPDVREPPRGGERSPTGNPSARGSR